MTPEGNSKESWDWIKETLLFGKGFKIEGKVGTYSGKDILTSPFESELISSSAFSVSRDKKMHKENKYILLKIFWYVFL